MNFKHTPTSDYDDFAEVRAAKDNITHPAALDELDALVRGHRRLNDHVLRQQNAALVAALRELDQLMRDCLLGPTDLAHDDPRMDRIMAAQSQARAALEAAGEA